MLISLAQQSESAICIHMSPYPLPLEPPSHPPYPTPLSHHKAQDDLPMLCCWFPQANYFTFSSVCMSMLLSLRPSFALPPHVMKSILYVYLFMPALQLRSSVPPLFSFFRFHIYVLAYGIYFSLSDLLHSVWQTLCPSTSVQMTQFRFFLWLSNIPLYICAKSSLSIHLSMDI